MVKNSQKQSGSALIVIVIIGVVIILGGLGFAFWNNMQSKNQAAQVSNQDTVNAPIKSEAAEKSLSLGAGL